VRRGQEQIRPAGAAAPGQRLGVHLVEGHRAAGKAGDLVMVLSPRTARIDRRSVARLRKHGGLIGVGNTRSVRLELRLNAVNDRGELDLRPFDSTESFKNLFPEAGRGEGNRPDQVSGILRPVAVGLARCGHVGFSPSEERQCSALEANRRRLIVGARILLEVPLVRCPIPKVSLERAVFSAAVPFIHNLRKPQRNSHKRYIAFE